MYCVSSYILSVYESVYLVVYPAMYLYVTVFVHLSINHVAYSFRLSMHVSMCVRTSMCECELDKKKIYVPPLGMKY